MAATPFYRLATYVGETIIVAAVLSGIFETRIPKSKTRLYIATANAEQTDPGLA